MLGMLLLAHGRGGVQSIHLDGLAGLGRSGLGWVGLGFHFADQSGRSVEGGKQKGQK